MSQTFTYDTSLPTWLDYARWRVDDTNAAAPLLWNETYNTLNTLFGPVEGLARAAGTIAVIISERVTAFGEAAGIRFNKDNLKYFQQLPDLIRLETPYAPGYVAKFVRSGSLTTTGAPASCCLPCGIPDTVRVWKCELLYPPNIQPNP